MEADAKLDERRQATVDANHSGVGAVDARDDLQQGALAASVRADDAEAFAALDRHAHVPQRLVQLVHDLPARVQEDLLDRRLALVRQAERLRHARELDRRAAHTRSANHGDSRRKSQSPNASVSRQKPTGTRYAHAVP
jgi:hypothetical protein